MGSSSFFSLFSATIYLVLFCIYYLNFSGLTNLEELYLSTNNISSACLPTNVFHHLQHLKALRIYDNHLTDIDDEIFSSLNGLYVLGLGYNKIANVSDEAFRNLTELKILNLAANNLTEINRNTLGFQTGSPLEELDLSRNQLRSVDSEAFQNLSNLHELSLNSNNFQSFPVAVRTLPKLKILKLSENMISELPTDSFQSSLVILLLQGNQIETIHPLAFKSSSNLGLLNLNTNKLATMNTRIFRETKKLKTLRLDYNELEDINGVLFSLSELQQLSISNNNIKW